MTERESKMKNAVFAFAVLAAALAANGSTGTVSVTNSSGVVSTIPAPDARLVYGPHAKQYVELWLPKGAAPAGGRPLAVYIHGGAWTSGNAIDGHVVRRLANVLERNVAFASVSYRYLYETKEVKPPVKAVKDDVVAALSKIRDNAASYGIRMDRLALSGGSAGACISLVVALSDGNPFGVDFVGAMYPQTSLDPKEMKEWVPNQGVYGAHAFGIGWKEFEARRDEMLPTIELYSPAALARKIDPAAAPEIVIEYPPANFPDEKTGLAKDPIHSAQFGMRFAEVCRERGIKCELLKGACNESWKRLVDRLVAP